MSGAPPMRFPAMGSTAEVVVVAPDHAVPSLVAAARDRLAHLEARWSRFLPDSDIARLNGACGRPVRVHPDTLRLVEAMRTAVVATEGAFDPTMLSALVDSGYARSMVDPAVGTVLTGPVRDQTPFHLVQTDAVRNLVELPEGCCLDAGGIGKGLAADLAVAELIERGADGVLVGIGGDVRVAGQSPQLGGWSIRLRYPADGADQGVAIRLIDGGVATSGTERRRWLAPDTTWRHHLLDPRTGFMVDDQDPRSPVEVTVVAGTAAWADAWTKAVFVDGTHGMADVGAGLTRLASLGLAARVRRRDGTVDVNDRWAAVACDDPRADVHPVAHAGAHAESEVPA